MILRMVTPMANNRARGVKRFGVSMSLDLARALERYRRSRGYRNRSAALAEMVREQLVQREWEAGRSQVVGTITIVYDHGTRELLDALTEVQHRFLGAIVCSTHVHLDEHHCLEVIVARGLPARLKRIADRLISTRGVKHGQLVCTTTGHSLA
jgi:CopG family nickel-responsive transcriptional regulator